MSTPMNIPTFQEGWTSKKIIQELEGFMSRDDAMLLLPEVISEEILTRAELKRVGRSLCDTVAIPGSSYSMLREETFEATEVPEGAEIPIARTSYEKINVTPYKIGIRPHLTREMVQDAQWDIIRRHVRNATDAMARKEDTDIIAALLAGVPDGTTIVGPRVADHIKGPTDWGGSSGDPINIKYTAEAINILDQEEMVADTMLIHPVQKRDLTLLEDFKDTTNLWYMSVPQRLEQVMRSGFVANWMGMDIFVSNRMTAGKVLIFDRSKYAILFERQPLTVERYDDVIRQMEGIAFSQRYVPAVVVNEAAVLIEDLATS